MFNFRKIIKSLLHKIRQVIHMKGPCLKSEDVALGNSQYRPR
jgi:hypothetical protein